MIKALSLTQASKFLNIRPDILKNIVKSESLIGVRKLGNKYLIDQKEIANFNRNVRLGEYKNV